MPVLEAGSWRSGLIVLGLSGAAVLAGVAGFNLHMRAEHGSAPDGFRLLEGVAGVLRDSVSTIRGFAGLLGEGKARDGPQLREACRFILEASEDLTGFIASLQDFARHEQGRVRLVEQQIEAAELAEAAVNMCQRTAERADVEIHADLSAGPELRCDPARLRGALTHLVAWAARGAPKGSAVRVNLLRPPEGGLAIAIDCPGPLRLAAGAAGPFEPDPGQLCPNGFALPIAWRVALLHSGEVTIEPGASSGTSLRLSLPPDRVTWPRTQENRAA